MPKEEDEEIKVKSARKEGTWSAAVAAFVGDVLVIGADVSTIL